MDINALYNELIMEHNQSSESKRLLAHPDFEEKGHNPSCGDEITVQVEWNSDKTVIQDIAFSGQGCAISQASASMMCDLLRGKSKEEAFHLVDTFIGMIKRECTSQEELDALEDAIAFQNISNMPARTKCAVLAWHTLKLAL